jgi:hypothetical protein
MLATKANHLVPLPAVRPGRSNVSGLDVDLPATGSAAAERMDELDVLFRQKRICELGAGPVGVPRGKPFAWSRSAVRFWHSPNNSVAHAAGSADVAFCSAIHLSSSERRNRSGDCGLTPRRMNGISFRLALLRTVPSARHRYSPASFAVSSRSSKALLLMAFPRMICPTVFHLTPL